MAKSKRSSIAKGKVRVSLDLSESFAERLEALEKLTHENKSSVIRHAIQLYEFTVNKTMEGCSFKVVDRIGRESDLVFFGAHVPPSKSREPEVESTTRL
jgi:predicted DNA-binding protein